MMMGSIYELVETFVNSGITFFESGLLLVSIFLILPICIYILLIEGVRIFDWILLHKFHRYRINSTYMKLKRRGWNVGSPKFEDPIFTLDLFEKEKK